MIEESVTKEELMEELRRLQERIRDFEVLKSEIKQSEEKLRIKDTAIETSLNGIAVADLAGNLTYVNRAILTMFGFDGEWEVLGMHFSEFAMDPAEALAIKEALLLKGSYVGEIEGKCRFGSPFVLEFCAGVVRDNSGMPLCLTFSGNDVTERKRAERALRESEERYRTLVESSPDGIVVASKDRIVFINTIGAKLLGGDDPQQFIGRSTMDFVHPDFRDDLKRRVHEIMGHKEQCGLMELKFIRVDGTPVDVELSDMPITYRNTPALQIIFRDITERRRMEEKIRYQAYHDLLTGLPNRALFMDRLNIGIAQANRNRTMLAVMFLDLDYFKNINDTLGHTIGDRLLEDVAARLKECIRESDTIARIGGDEFNILLPDIAHADDAVKIAKKIVSAFNEPYVIEGRVLPVTTSIGISLYPGDGREADSLLKSADIAMYHAKEQGRKNYQFYNTAMNARNTERVILESSLAKMIERDELVLYYQPQLDMSTRHMVSAEALVRWQHPELGLLRPKQFIPLAEETGFISSIDEWVLHTACSRSKAWQDSGYSPIRIAVNLSAGQFQQPDFPETLSRVLRTTGLNPEFLEFDITESTAMQDIGLAGATLRRLVEIGVKVSIDDFGAGQSSLSQLVKLPIHKLKIDIAFIRSLASDPNYRTVINAVITLAHNLQLGVVAEGVETNEQLAFLCSTKCDEMQGYLFSEPLPEDKFKKLIMFRK